MSFLSAKRFGVTEVPAETVNYISHATQARLRSMLEKVSTIAQHRTDGGKVSAGRVGVVMNRST